MKTKKCRCFIYHPANEEERKVVTDNMDYFRKVGDSQGLLLTLAQLGECASRNES